MTIKNLLQDQLKKIVKEFGVSDSDPKIEYPSDPKHGDYATNVALVVAKKLKRNPMELAEEIVAKLRMENREWGMEVVKPGFINLEISEKSLSASIEKQEFPDLGNGRPVVVEYSSPNIAKPFTIGHLRSTIIGDAIANLLQATGWKVYRDNHVGDWGTQFGKQIYALIRMGEGSLEKNLEKIEKSPRPVKDLVALYVAFHEKAEKDPSLEEKARVWFKKLEDGDPEARRLWQQCIDWSWKEFSAIYDELGIPTGGTTFENNGRGYGESFFEDKMAAVIDELQEKQLLTTGKEGAQIVTFPEETKLPPLMILKKDGATLYATRDLATDKFRLERYGRDVTVVNEVGAEQSLYFNQVFQLEEMLGWYKKGQRVHVKHGLYRFKDEKMSTRKGNVIWLEDVLAEAVGRALAFQEQKTYVKKFKANLTEVSTIVKQVGIGALKWNDLKRSSEQDITFDWEDILNMQGNSGPYIQYTYARTQSVLLKAGISNSPSLVKQEGSFPSAPTSNSKLEDEERRLLLLLSRFPEIVEEAAVRYAPHILCTYLFDVAQAFNGFYQTCPILKADQEKQEVRLFLTASTGNVVKEGLRLLGIQAPAQM